MSSKTKYASVSEALAELMPEPEPEPIGPSELPLPTADWPRGGELANALLEEVDQYLARRKT